MVSSQLILNDCLVAMKDMADNSVDSIVTDPPYGLSAARNSGNASKGGFMGKLWDYDVPSVEIWKEALRVLKPGGHLLAFGGTRTYHRLAVNVEDAGFEIRDQIMWIYGSGFPKSMNISKAIDNAAGAEREVIGIGRSGSPDTHQTSYNMSRGAGTEKRDNFGGEYDITTPATPEAEQWEGWGTALKPAHEPIVVARKPVEKDTIADNVLEHGTGGLNIDKCRIGDIVQNTADNGRAAASHKATIFESGLKKDFEGTITTGRFPANVIFECICDQVINTEIKGDGHWADSKVTGFGDGIGDGTSEYRGVGPKESKTTSSHTNPECPCRILDEQAPKVGNMMNATRKTTTSGGTGNSWTTSSKNEGDSNGIFDGLGGASRFFHQVKQSEREVNELTPEHEPIVVARKPIEGTVADNVLEHGTGGINIDECRIPTDENIELGRNNRKECSSNSYGTGLMGIDRTNLNQGRFPANVILDEEAGKLLDEQSGHLKSGDMDSIAKGGQFNTYGVQQERRTTQIGDEGGASRFFYCAKPSRAERDGGLEGFVAQNVSDREDVSKAGANNPRNRGGIERKNIHPTVKPVDLMKYLTRLVTPPEGLVLDPFMGSGTTGIAANLEGFSFIGIEMDEEYLEISRARIAHSGDYEITEDLTMKRIKQPTLFDFLGDPE